MTVAVLTSRPVAFAAIVPVTVNVARSPASSVTVVARLPVPEAAAQLDPGSATQVQVGDTKAAGNVSVTLAAVTGLGPDVGHYDRVGVGRPGTGLPVSVLVIARSAIVCVVSVTLAVLSDGSGSG